MHDDLHIPFDRITYRDGQLLTALDLRDDQARHTRLRELHTRFLHHTWGIALGLEVTQAVGGGALVIGPGSAVDEEGRYLLLAEGIHERIPGVSGPETLVLTVQYQENAAFRDRPDLAALCLHGGLDPRHERPVFTWRIPDQVRFGNQVPLVQIEVEAGKIKGNLDFRVRRYTRPLVYPHIAGGVTEPGLTGWHTWPEKGPPLGVEVKVDTTEAGFITTPYYFVALQGDFSEMHPEVWPPGMRPEFFMGAMSFITRMSQDSFLYRVLNAEGFPSGAEVSPGEAEEREWTLSWWGVEPVTGCEPSFHPTRFFPREVRPGVLRR